MSIQRNINKRLDENYKNTNYLPQKLLLEDVDGGMRDFIVDIGITVKDAKDKTSKVPVIFLTQERWAEFKMNWKFLKDESGEETYSDGQGYMKINGYDIPSVLGDPSEDNTVDSIDADRYFQLVYPLTVHSRIVDPNKFERVQTITKISIEIQEDEC